jgi:dipeptidyl aminopeptidase/acylaminoacyl peptidase
MTELIPRKLFFGNPDKALAKISPDGENLAYLAPRDGVLNVWVAPRGDLNAARPVTHDTVRGIREYGWAYTNNHLFYIQDKNGDENWRIYLVDLITGDIKDLTPFEGVQARIEETSHIHPHQILISINNRDPQLHDLYRLDIKTGEMVMVQECLGFLGYLIDHDLRLRGAVRMTPEGGLDLLKPAGPSSNGEWVEWDTTPAEDMLTTNPICFDKEARTIFLRDSRSRNTSALVAQDFESGHKILLAEDPQADAADVIVHPTRKHVQAVAFIYDRKRWQVLDPKIQPDLDYLATVARGDVEITSRSLDDRFWVVVYLVDDSPSRYYLYDRQAGRAEFLFTNRSQLEGKPLVKMHPAIIKSRDGLDLVAYYSLPYGSDTQRPGIPDRPVPMVFNPHGGPWGRDLWGYNPWHQWLANRGYAVLSVNFRSSTGFGKAFINAGDLEWGGKIMEDQIDAVQWAVEQGIADPDRIAVMGGSFGGYSTLAGLTFYPEVFACGVDIVGPSNIITLLESIPPYWKPMLELFTTRVGDFRTEEGRALLEAHSPLTHVDRICKPLLIAQGAHDPRVKQAESDQIVQAMQAKDIPVTYVLYTDEGHGFARPENALSFSAITEAFLSRCLGGRYEEIGDDFQGANLEILAGKEAVPGL